MSTLEYTPIAELPQIYETLQTTFAKGTTLPLAWRKHQLLQLARMAQENKDAFIAAIKGDLNKPSMETLIGEVGPVVERSIQSAQQLDDWAKPEKVVVPEWQSSWSPTVYRTPKGVVLIIAPWNYPMILSLQPLIGAIAAGCPAILKVSEITAHYAKLIAELLPKYLDSSAYRIVNGSVMETTRLLDLKWDHIFYTGNGRVGRIIAGAAARHLTPVTLELGGKSPVVIDANSDLKVAAKRILRGKATNAGQICVSPDYVLIPRSAQVAFVEALKEAYDAFYPDGALQSDSYASIVSQGHYDRLQDLLKHTKAQAVLGGKSNGKRIIEPTMFTDVGTDDVLMEDEIFGPLLPIVPIKDIQEAIRYINSKPHPLVLYVFTDDPQVKQAFQENTRSGSLAFNDTFQQIVGSYTSLFPPLAHSPIGHTVNELPFSGIGESGYGCQVMKYTYDGFTHLRSTTDIPMQAEPRFGPRYPPYTEENIRLIATAADLIIPSSSSTEGIIGV